MTPPELLVEAWMSAQNAFLASKALEEERAAEAEAENAAPAPEPQSEPQEGEFWQDWFGIWR